MSQGETVQEYQRSGIPRPRRDYPTQSAGITGRGWMKERHFHCKRCGKDHPSVDCIGMPVECFNCGKKGHRSFECQTSTREGSFRPSQSQGKTQQSGIQEKARSEVNMANSNTESTSKSNVLQQVVRDILYNVPLYRETTNPLILLLIFNHFVEINRTNHLSNANKLSIGLAQEAFKGTGTQGSGILTTNQRIKVDSNTGSMAGAVPYGPEATHPRGDSDR
nr:probable serine/threonine-protein kinase clkA [Ipomoea batatas]